MKDIIMKQAAYKFFAVALTAGLLTACQSTPDTLRATTDKSAGSKQLSANVLPPRNLAPGECGLFVWAGEARRFILFVQNGQSAVLAKNGQETALSVLPATVSGDLYGQIPVQNFTDSDGMNYALTLTAEEEIDGGIRYSSGTWRYKDSAGWDVLKPVYGLSTCQPLS